MSVCTELGEALQHFDSVHASVQLRAGERSMCHLHSNSRVKVKGTYGNVFCPYRHICLCEWIYTGVKAWLSQIRCLDTVEGNSTILTVPAFKC